MSSSTLEHRFFAAIYETLNSPNERSWLGARRGAMLGDLRGEVLEIGGGTGANPPPYRAASRVVLPEPDPPTRKRIAGHLAQARVGVELSSAAAERLPFPDGSFDVVVSTLVLCSVSDPPRALGEARRVLRKGGRLVFVEHVRDERND